MSSSSPSMASWQSARTTGSAPAMLRLGRESGNAAIGAVDWELKRNCSMAPRQVLGFYLSLCAVSLLIATGFWWHGVPAVMPFAWVELLAVGVALWVYARHAGDRESIALRDGRLTVVHANGSQVEHVEFQPAWVRVEPEHGDNSLIELSGQGRRIRVGRFVRPELRRQLAEELRWALRRWHQGGGGAPAV